MTTAVKHEEHRHLNPHHTSRHDRFVERFGSAGWLYLTSAAPWIVLYVVVRAAWSFELDQPADAIPVVTALLTGVGVTARARKGRSTSHPPGGSGSPA